MNNRERVERMRQLREEARTAKERHEVPSPDEMEAALERVQKTASITFELDINGWRIVYLTSAVPMPNTIIPALTVVYFKPVLAVATPYMPEIPGWLSVTLSSLATGRATLLVDERAITVGFRATCQAAEDWLKLELARAAGMKFREHSILKPDEVIYTKTP